MLKLTRKQQAKINKIGNKYGLKIAVVFGSFVRGKMHQRSDIDIAVSKKNSQSLDLTAYSNISHDFSKIFENKEIDISQIDYASPLLLNQINKTGEKLYGHKKDFDKFKLYSFHRYNDYKPYLKLEEKFVDNYIKNL